MHTKIERWNENENEKQSSVEKSNMQTNTDTVKCNAVKIMYAARVNEMKLNGNALKK